MCVSVYFYCTGPSRTVGGSVSESFLHDPLSCPSAFPSRPLMAGQSSRGRIYVSLPVSLSRLSRGPDSETRVRGTDGRVGVSVHCERGSRPDVLPRVLLKEKGPDSTIKGYRRHCLLVLESLNVVFRQECPHLQSSGSSPSVPIFAPKPSRHESDFRSKVVPVEVPSSVGGGKGRSSSVDVRNQC